MRWGSAFMWAIVLTAALQLVCLSVFFSQGLPMSWDIWDNWDTLVCFAIASLVAIKVIDRFVGRGGL